MTTPANELEFSPIDPSAIPFPVVVETLTYEDILAEMVADLMLRDPAFDSLSEADTVHKVLEVAALREVNIRQRVNDAAKAVTLAYSTSTDLDNLGALFGVLRLADETDDALRVRITLALEGFSVAGPAGAYVFHARSADPTVKDIDVRGRTPGDGDVTVTVLSSIGDGTPDPALLVTVYDYLSDETRRPITDQVFVVAPTIVNYTIEAVLWLFDGPDATVTLAQAQANAEAYIELHHRLGHDIPVSGVHAALHIEGVVQRVDLIQPAADIVITPQEAPYNTAIILSVGGTDE